ncbi:hypothetical protein N7494_013075 [Penicillium frequentans]|uniref:Alcohol acetyltransferase n=1 Tax=Penicillium frequentans TaxID=3151616 RepID=A0AAD6CPF7_9EURO|nr:hypothetical protein N7494_013075 [Penicillium glabrum]
MSEPETLMRFASPNERRTISREELGFYNALIVGGVYEIPGEQVDLNSPESFIAPLEACILKYSFLSTIVKNKHTEKPAYYEVPTIDLHDHIAILQHDNFEDDDTSTFESILPQILDRPWPADIPPWRIVILPLPSPDSSAVKRCLIVFAFSHTIGDGMVGVAFHRTFLEAWRQGVRRDGEESFLVSLPGRSLPAPFDTRERLTISWNFLLAPLIAVHLPKFLAAMLGLHARASTVDAGTWTGSRSFYDPAVTDSSRVKMLEIEAPLVQKSLQICRKHDTKLTGALHQMIVRALSKAIPDPSVTNFVSGTAVDMRRSVGIPSLSWGLYVSGQYDVHQRARNVESPALPDEMWINASLITKSLAECSTRLHDQAIGLLRYIPSIRNWTLGKVGAERDCSYEVSNLLAFDDGNSEADQKCSITKMIFSQPANVPSGPLVFNFISVKGGSLMCTVSWQSGALGVPVEKEMPFVDDICSSIQADFASLQE